MRKPAIIAATLTLLLTTACSVSPGEHSDPGDDAVTVQNCGHELEFDSAPERVVVKAQVIVELLDELGLADRIVGWSPAGGLDGPSERNQETEKLLDEIPKISDGEFPRDVVVDQDADLLYSDMDYGGDMRDKYAPLDIPVLFATMYCPEYAPEKPDERPDSIASRYQDIQDVGRIFRVEDRAEDLVDKMRNRVESASAQANENKPRVAGLTFYDSVDGPMSATAGNSLGNQMIEVAGGTNVYDDLEGSSTDEVNAESLIDRDPDVIAIRLHSSGPDFDTIRNFLRQDERFKDISAVQNDRFTKIYNSEHFAGVRFPDAIDRLAEAFAE